MQLYNVTEQQVYRFCKITNIEQDNSNSSMVIITLEIEMKIDNIDIKYGDNDDVLNISISNDVSNNNINNQGYQGSANQNLIQKTHEAVDLSINQLYGNMDEINLSTSTSQVGVVQTILMNQVNIQHQIQLSPKSPTTAPTTVPTVTPITSPSAVPTAAPTPGEDGKDTPFWTTSTMILMISLIILIFVVGACVHPCDRCKKTDTNETDNTQQTMYRNDYLGDTENLDYVQQFKPFSNTGISQTNQPPARTSLLNIGYIFNRLQKQHESQSQVQKQPIGNTIKFF